MRPPIVATHRLPRRTRSFGSSTLGKTLDWITTTWFRLSIFISAVAYIVILLSSDVPTGFPIPVAFLPPVGAAAVLFWIKLVVFVCSFFPVAGPIAGFSRVLFYKMFCRLVAEPAPKLEIPLWFHR